MEPNSATYSADLKGVFGIGDEWTWTAICADTKVICSYMVGAHTSEVANAFVGDLAGRLRNRVQLTTDGHCVYLNAVEKTFAGDIDYGMFVKQYGDGQQTPERKYSPVEFVSEEKKRINGKPDKAHISTSYVERQKLTMRMGMRRLTRLTNAFSKKVENHAHAVALHFMHYNFGRINKTLRVTPAMEAGVSNHVWSLAEIAALVPKPVATKRGPYKKRTRDTECQ